MKEIFVSPFNSSDNNEGTIDSPLASIQKAHDLAEAGDTIYLRGGTYLLPKNETITLWKSGTEEAPIRLFAYQNEQPVIDGSRWDRREQDADPRRDLISQTGDYWHVKGLEMVDSPHAAYTALSASHSVWENLNLHDNENTGLNIFGESTDNLVLGGDFHHNFDPIRNGQDADGIGVKFGSGEGNVIRGARLYNNSDDGIDLWDFGGSVTIEDTWAYGNGVDRWDVGAAFEGNGNGFKLSGGRGERPASSLEDLAHVVRNNLAWSNTSRGFDYNNSQGAMQVYGNTSYNNAGVGYRFSQGAHKLRNNLSVNDNNGAQPFQTGGQVDDASNSWTLDVTAEADDFLSTDDSIATRARSAEGALPESDFLKLKADSDLVDAGISVGEDFQGAAPDLGAYEAQAPRPAQRPTDMIIDYDFEKVNGDVVFDEVVRGGDNAGALRGAVYEEDRGNRYVAFDGDDHIAVPDAGEINLEIQPQRTIAFWFRATDTALDSRKQVLYEEGGKVRGLNVYIDEDRLYVGGWNRPDEESGWAGTWLSTDKVESDKWHHVAIALDGEANVQADALTGYLDGEVFGRGEGSQLWAHSDNIGLGNVSQGTRFHDGSLGHNSGFVGAIDGFKLYNSAATLEQVQALVG